MNQARLIGVCEVMLLAKSPENMARELKLSTNAIQKWIKNGYVPNKHVMDVARIYGVPPERLCKPKYLAS